MNPSLFLFFWMALIVGFAKAVADTLMTHYSGSVFSFEADNSFFGEKSWVRKYKNFDPAQGERFFLSSTLLVFLTDGWHLSNAIQMAAFVNAMYIGMNWHLKMNSIEALAMFWSFRSMSFHFFYTYGLRAYWKK